MRHVQLANHCHWTTEQDEESDADYAGTEASCGNYEADVTAKQMDLAENEDSSPHNKLTPSSSFTTAENGLRNIPRSPRIDWSASVPE
jgi:hypothetical protein